MTTLNSRNRRRIAILGFAATLASASGVVFAQYDAPNKLQTETTPVSETPEAIIRNWPKELQALARVLIERYGKPGLSTAKELVWFNNSPWRKTVLHREGFTYSALGKDGDHLEQTITYKVPKNKIADLQSFDKRIEVNQDTDDLTSHADSEPMNYLALNLVDDIVKGQRSVLAARGFYQKVKVFEKMGKSSPYLNGFIFTMGNEKVGKSAKSNEPGL